MLARRRDLRRLGVTARTEARRVERAGWVRPCAGVVADQPVGVWDLLRAALLRAGDPVGLTGATGAEVLLERTPTLPLELAVPYGRKIASEAVVFSQTRHWVDPVYVRGWPVVPPAVVGARVAAGARDEDDRRALATALVQRGLTTPEDIAAAAATTPTRVRRQVARLIEELLAHAESCPEAKIWRGQVERRMPVPLLNHPLHLTHGKRSLDGYLAPLRAGYEIQGREHHEGTWRADNVRAAQILVECGIVLLPLMAEQVLYRLDDALDLLAAFWRGRAAELGVDLPVFAAPERWRP